MIEFTRYFNECQSPYIARVTKSSIIGVPAFELRSIFHAKVITSQWRSSFDKLSVTVRWNVVECPGVHAPCIGERLHYAARGRVRSRAYTHGTNEVPRGNNASTVTVNGPKRCTGSPSRYGSDTYSTCVTRLDLVAFEFT